MWLQLEAYADKAVDQAVNENKTIQALKAGQATAIARQKTLYYQQRAIMRSLGIKIEPQDRIKPKTRAWE